MEKVPHNDDRMSVRRKRIAGSQWKRSRTPKRDQFATSRTVPTTAAGSERGMPQMRCLKSKPSDPGPV